MFEIPFNSLVSYSPKLERYWRTMTTCYSIRTLLCGILHLWTVCSVSHVPLSPVTDWALDTCHYFSVFTPFLLWTGAKPLKLLEPVSQFPYEFCTFFSVCLCNPSVHPDRVTCLPPCSGCTSLPRCAFCTYVSWQQTRTVKGLEARGRHIRSESKLRLRALVWS